MNRVLEPEVMDQPDQASAYAKADFSDSNAAYVRELVSLYGRDLENAVDFGCGPGDVVVRIARAHPQARITAVDASPSMLSIARKAVESGKLAEQIRFVEGRLPGLSVPPRSFSAILCKDMLHHLHNPAALWQEVQRLGKPGAAVYVMDLIRPDSPELARQTVERVAANEDPLLKTDFFNSLCAAFTVAEVQEQLRSAGLTLNAEQVSDRHLRISGRLAGS